MSCGRDQGLPFSLCSNVLFAGDTFLVNLEKLCNLFVLDQCQKHVNTTEKRENLNGGLVLLKVLDLDL